MEPTEHLLNQGIIHSGPRPTGEERTVIVLGAGRGGTSLCSTSLHKLGIFTGSDSWPPIFEDIPLSKALEKRDLARAKSIISDYNKDHKIWAFKRPTTNNTISELHKMLRNPRYVVVFRDVLAIGQRNFLSMHEDPFGSMRNALSDYEKILNFLKEHNPPALLLSYEKAVGNPENFIRSLVTFCGLDSSVKPVQISSAVSSIKPSPKEYLIKTSAIDNIGYLDIANSSYIAGWASFDKTDRTVELELFVNDKKVCDFIPKQFRGDILEKGLHPTGYCGYQIDFPSDSYPSEGDLVSVRFKDTGMDLRNSPKRI